ncbi:NifB/NifX family molybdenum-iron cluster-binding protein [Desulfospira joergensenii]|uniref:NifB/NifX family molybdenum-iron cluster-binding protein n=1 Tax=Desulfospira joergensenii TaxID=53329 RepID=UPI0003B54B5E|nr:NifB/NifX family molybdenum-iron cluster-binding protein [Desulfospira joergensenii]
MKIAITSKGRGLDAQVDPRFGRASYIIVVDTDTKEFEVIDNENNKNAFKGAGIQAASSISEKGAKVLLTGFCGPNAFKTLDAAGIKVANDADGTVSGVIEQFNKGKFTYADGANVDGHW